MKVIFILSRIEKSGVAIHTLDLARGLVSLGHELTMITGGLTEPNHPFLQSMLRQFEDLGIDIHYFDMPKGNIFSKTFLSIRLIFRVVSLLKQIPADMVHSQSPYLTFLPWLARKKFVTTVHNVQLRKNLKYKNPTHLIAISEASKQYAIANLGVKPGQVTVVCHGVSERYGSPVPIKVQDQLKTGMGIPKEAILIGYAGRLDREKGLDHLIAAFSLVKGNAGYDVHLILLGDYYTEQDSRWLSGVISQSGSGAAIHLVPFQDPKPFYDIFDIFVLPSLSEAFGLVCVEAMMSSCCTIRTDTNGAEDQIDHGVNGFIYPVGAVAELHDILLKVIQDPSLRIKIGENARVKALERFTIKTMAKNTEAVYKRIL